jgi:hypothetical protein
MVVFLSTRGRPPLALAELAEAVEAEPESFLQAARLKTMRHASAAHTAADTIFFLIFVSSKKFMSAPEAVNTKQNISPERQGSLFE